MRHCRRPSGADTSSAIARRRNWPTATATAATASGGISRDVRGLPQEKDQIQKAADDYRRALELYQGIVPYSSANINIVRVQGSLSAIEYRLADLQSDQKF